MAAAIAEGGDFPGRWVDAGDLEVGDLLLLRDGRQALVEAIVVRPSNERIYNFAVDDLHNYAVGPDGALVHNNCARDVIEKHHLLPQQFKGILADAGLDI